MSDTRTTEDAPQGYCPECGCAYISTIEATEHLLKENDTLTSRLEALEAERDRAESLLAAYVGARDFDDGCLCPECIAAIDRRLAAAHELAEHAERVMGR